MRPPILPILYPLPIVSTANGDSDSMPRPLRKSLPLVPVEYAVFDGCVEMVKRNVFGCIQIRNLARQAKHFGMGSCWQSQFVDIVR